MHRRLRLGLVNVVNSRGLGTESRILKSFFRAEMPEVDFSIYRLPSGRRSKAFDEHWPKSFLFRRWMRRQDWIMTIETLMPRLFEACREAGIGTLWRPNQEWIAPIHRQEDLEKIDCIMTPQLDCAQFIRSHFGVHNVVANPWIMDLPVHRKDAGKGPMRFLFNAGRGGIGERRNQQVVVDAFADVLSVRKDVHFFFKTQTPMDVSALDAFKGNRFRYVCSNTRYEKNIALYRDVDFSLAPSKWEGVGFALLESLYQGTPVLTVDAPPMNEWVSDRVTGYLVPAQLADVETPIPYPGNSEMGLHWVRAALCDPKDVADGIHWLADNRRALYECFNRENARTLDARRQQFVDTWRRVLQGGA